MLDLKLLSNTGLKTVFINRGSAPDPEIYRIRPNGSSWWEPLLADEQLTAFDPLGIDAALELLLSSALSSAR